MKLLKRKILFCLASEVDFFKLGDNFDYYPYLFLYQRLFNFNQSSIRGAILQLVRSGEVDKISRNNIALFRLTARGREKLLSFFPLSLGQKRVWDKIWRVAIIKSKTRELRRVLKRFGFRKMARGAYITPLPISAKLREFLLENDFSANIAVIESRKLLLADDKQMAKTIWPLTSLLEKYQKLIKQMETLLMRLKKQKGLTNQSKKQFSLILNNFFSLLEKDPGLPNKLLLADWPADLTKETWLKLAVLFKNKEKAN